MKYAITCDLPGYLRLRADRYAISEEDSYALAAALQRKEEIDKVEVNFFSGSVLVHHHHPDSRKLAQEIANIDIGSLPPVPMHERDQSVKIAMDFQMALGSVVAGRVFRVFFLPTPITTAITLAGTARYVWRGLKTLLKGDINVDVLDGAAVGLSVAFGHFASASQIMFLLSIADILEEYTKQRTRNALSSALIFNVDKVWVRQENGVEVQKSIVDLELDEKIVVRTGSMIPVDGEVVEGTAGVNQASMTGESMPVMKTIGDSVFAGTVVAEGDIVIAVKALQNESRIQNILNMVENSDALKAATAAKAEALADRIVPYSFLFAALVLVLTRNGHKALSALTVDYSCAIKLATPIAVISAMSEASHRKVMVKGGKFMEALAEADTIVFDKTGTLTMATPEVQKVLALSDMERDEVLRLAACLEEHFPHSLARAIVRKAEEEELHHREEHAEVEYIVAHGIVSRWNGVEVYIGSEHFLVDDNDVIITDEQQAIIAKEGFGYSCVYLAVDKKLVGVICIQDPPRQEARAMIARLRELGIENVVMLTGDGEAIAKNIADELGIDRYFAQVLPEDKAGKVKLLQEEGHKVIMVGDGVNDTPALAQSDVSISLRDSSDIAREVADVTLLSGSLNSICEIRLMSQRLMARIEGNFRTIFGFNTALLVLGAIGLLQPTTTALLHNVSTAVIGMRATRPLLPAKKEEKDGDLIDVEAVEVTAGA